MQLVAYGAQDIYLTGNPQITFFKIVYRRHTNFSMESIEQTFNGTAGFGKKVSVTVSRNGDLITKCYLQATLPATTVSGGSHAWISEVGHFLIKSVEVEIGGQRIDKHYGAWLSIWNSLTLPKGKEEGYDKMIGKTTANSALVDTAKAAYDLYVPLQFWFCRFTGLALPLIALQYHEVKFSLEFETKANLMVTTGTLDSTDLSNTSMYIDYIYLDTDERRRFAQISHEYLIEQLQFTGDESLSGTSNKIKLNFNHPVKELIFVKQDDAIKNDNFTNHVVKAKTNASPISNAKLQLNGHDRFSERKARYFTQVQPYQHHTRIPEYEGIHVYSFALKPEEQQPSGSCNMSRIDNATLNVTLPSATTGAILKVYATNYNVLRIMSGMGGLAYSN